MGQGFLAASEGCHIWSGREFKGQKRHEQRQHHSPCDSNSVGYSAYSWGMSLGVCSLGVCSIKQQKDEGKR